MYNIVTPSKGRASRPCKQQRHTYPPRAATWRPQFVVDSSDQVPPLAWAHERRRARRRCAHCRGGINAAGSFIWVRFSSLYTPWTHLSTCSHKETSVRGVHLIGYRPSPGRTNGGGRVGGVRTAAAAFKLQRASYGVASHPCTPQGHTFPLAAIRRPPFVVQQIRYRPSPGRTKTAAGA